MHLRVASLLDPVGKNSPPDCFLPQTASAPSLFESLFLFCQSKKQALRPAFHFGGELGIRTLGTLRTQHFESIGKNRTWRNLTEDNGKYKNPENAVFSRLSAPLCIENAVKIRVRKFPPNSPSSNGFSEKPIRIFDRTERFFTPKITLLAVREKSRLCRTAPKVVWENNGSESKLPLSAKI